MKAIIGCSPFVLRDFEELRQTALDMKGAQYSGQITQLAIVYDHLLTPKKCTPNSFELHVGGEVIKFAPGCKIDYYGAPRISTGAYVDLCKGWMTDAAVHGSCSIETMATALSLRWDVPPMLSVEMSQVIQKVLLRTWLKQPFRLWTGAIKCAAILHRPTATTYEGITHAAVIADLINVHHYPKPTGSNPAFWVQGFVTHENIFLDRVDGLIVAERYGQVDGSYRAGGARELDSGYYL